MSFSIYKSLNKSTTYKVNEINMSFLGKTLISVDFNCKNIIHEDCHSKINGGMRSAKNTNIFGRWSNSRQALRNLADGIFHN